MALVLLPEKQIFGFCYLNLKNWNHPLVGIEPKDITKPESRRRKDLSHAASKEDTGDLSESRVSPAAKLRKSKAKDICVSLKVFEQRRVQHRVENST